jgi:molecular chaperone GrpE (heat shock protein)
VSRQRRTIEDLGREVAGLAARVEAVERRQRQLVAALEGAVEEVREAASSQRQSLAALHRDLLGERRAVATQSVFGAVVAALDSLDAMLSELGPDGSRQTRTQLGAVASTLRNVLQALGYEAFHAEVGEPFTPARMEPLGYADGAPGVVLATVRPGYANRRGIVRPAGVLVANSAAADPAADQGGQA